jgi:signal peptidase I
MSARRDRGEAAAQRAPARATPEAAAPGLAARLWDQFGTLVVAVGLALAIRAFVIEPYRIPSGSMLPTLLIGDHLFVNKFVYGIKVPFTDRRLPALRDPERGDVVVFTVARGPYDEIQPVDARPDLPHDRFVKRLVGLPGDRIEVRGSELLLNGKRVPVESSRETFQDEHGRPLKIAREGLDGREHAILDDAGVAGPQQAPFTVPAGRYFVMGDNRDWSNDSRRWGTVRLADLKGPAFVLYWSWDWQGGWLSLLNPITWWDLLTTRTRWDRIGDPIE